MLPTFGKPHLLAWSRYRVQRIPRQLKSTDRDTTTHTTHTTSSTTKAGGFKSEASISVDDRRPSPFNLSLKKELRVFELNNLKHFVPGDITPPQPIQNLNLQQKLETKLDSTVDPNLLRHNRKVLTRKIVTPYYQDFHDLRATDGKLFEALETDIPAQKALYMPNFSLQALTPKLNQFSDAKGKVELYRQLENKVSLVAFYFTQFGEDQAKTFTQAFLQGVQLYPHTLQLVEVNVSENLLKSFIARCFLSRIRTQLSQAQQANYLLKYGSIEPIKEKLAMVNAILGYVFLVDKQGKIRWFANGKATPTELHTMKTIATRLL